MRARIVIVGGGVMGTSIAMHAARRCDPLAEPVVLLEKNALAAGSSGRSGAILRQHYSTRELAGMARDSLREYASFYRRTGRWIGFRSTGVLTLAGPERPEFMAQVERNVAMQRSIGIDTRLVDAQEIRGLVAGIEVDDAAVAAYEPGAGFVDPLRTVEAFATLARAAGATTRMGVSLTGLAIEGGRVRAVETDAGPIEAEQVVVAAGPWTKRVAQGAGIELPLEAVRPEQYFVTMPAPTLRPAREDDEPAGPPQVDEDHRFGSEQQDEPLPAHPVLLDLERNVYARCEARYGRTRVGKLDTQGSAAIEDPDRISNEISSEFRAWAHAGIAARMPVYSDQVPVVGELGLYTLTPDARALIGPVAGVEGLFVVSGFSGHGFKLAPSVGEGVTQMLFGEPVSAFEPLFFAPERFAQGRSAEAGGLGF
jgi:glycine/D-amino acid oxidase-like deaminating enzyme